MKHIGLFEGIGGFSLAARWMGWETIAWCEWNEFCQKVLSYHFPEANKHGDITKTDFTIYRGKCDILTGGFPCQPYSLAGKRKGNEDDRHLWPEMLRAIREIQPRWVVGENVYGLINWSGGLVFHEVQADLEAEGYEVFPYVLPACAVNAPHRRDRVWFVAYCNYNGQHRCDSKNEINAGEGGEYALNDIEPVDADNSNTIGLEKAKHGFPLLGKKKRNKIAGDIARTSFTDWQSWPTQPPVCSGNDGLPSELDGITVSKHRKESLMAYGNAVVPQLVYEIFKAIELFENTQNRV